MFTHVPNRVVNISALAFSPWNGNLAQHLWFMVFKKLRKNSIKVNSKWFLSAIVAYSYTPVSRFSLQTKSLNHNPVKFATRKQGAVPD